MPDTSCFHSLTLLVIVTIVSVSVIAFSSSNKSYACETSPPVAPSQDQFDNSAAIFSGKVVKIQNYTVNNENDWNLVSFEVDRYWKTINKNTDYEQIILFTAPDSGACGYEFEVGKTYLVYAIKWFYDPDYLYTSIGYRNQPIEDARQDLAFLGEGKEPARKEVTWQEQIGRITIQPIQTGQEEQAISKVISIIGVGVAIAGGVAFLSLRKLRDKNG